MPTTIDSLQIEIQSNSTSAAKGIGELARSLEGLRNSGKVTTAVNNLKSLSGTLRDFTDASNATRSIGKLVGAMNSLKGVGSVTSIAGSVKKLGESLKTVESINIDNVAPKIEKIANALTPLSSVKAGGINTMTNGLLKLKKVTDSLDDDTISKFAEKIEKLNTVLKPLSDKMTSIHTGFKSINTRARSASSGVRQLGEDVNTTALNLSSIITVIQNVAHALQNLVQKIINVMGAAIEWDGIAARFGRGFGASAQETYDWIQRLNEEMGINVQQFMQYSSVYATMLTGFGVAVEDAGKMALGYTELTYDIWAGYNDIYNGFADAAEAVKSAIAGEVEPIRRAGFTIVESTLEQTAANHGLSISLEKATEAQKSYLRYLTLVDQAQAQGLVGTYAKELNTAEGLMRTFSQQMKSLTQAFGSLFLPILVKVMPYFQAFIELLTEGVRMLAGLFGFEIQAVDWSGYESGAGAIDSVADSATGASGALKDATKAAKELKNATVGIDELNVISPPTSSSGSGAGGAGGAGGNGFENLDVDSLWDASIFDDVKSKVSDIVQKMKDWLGLTDDIDTWAEFFDTRLGGILKLVGLIGAGIALWKVSKGFLDAIDMFKGLIANPSYSITLGAVITLTGFAIEFTGLKDAILNGLDGFNFGEIVGGGLLGTGGATLLGAKIASWISTAFAGSKVATAISTAATNLGVGSASAAGAALGAGIGGVIAGIPAMFVGIYDAITNEIDWLNATLTAAGGAAAGAGVATILTAAGTAVAPGIGTLVGLAVGLLIDGIILAVQNWDEIKKFFNETVPQWFDGINWKAVGKKIGEYLTNCLISIVNPFLGFSRMIEDVFDFEIDWNAVGKALGTGLGKAVKFAGDAVEFLDEWLNPYNLGKKFIKWFTDVDWRQVWSDVVNFVTKDIPKWWEDVGSSCVSGIWQGMTESWDDFISDVKGFISGFVKGFKDALGIKSPSKVFATIGTQIIDGLKSTLSVNAIKDKLSSMWTTAKNWWDKSKSALKSYTPSIGSIYEKVKERWDNARIWWNDKKTAMKQYTPSIGSIYEKVSERWKNARDWYNKKKSGMSTYTPSIGSIKDRLVSAWNTAKSWWNKNVRLSIPSLSFKVSYTNSGLNTAQKAIVKALGLSGWPSLKFAANGGIFDQGSLVWAGERGPEVMATASGGRTGVMNVQQMQDAMYEGVYAAVVAAMRATGGENGGQAVNVYLDSKQITAAVERRQHERGVSILGKQVYGY